jgi:thiol:disulfide interchange protein DsbD
MRLLVTLLTLCLPALVHADAPPVAHHAPPSVPASAIEEGALDGGDARVVAQLVTDTLIARPGDTIRVGVLLTPDPHWHVYWRYSGDAGLPTSVTWRLPQGAARPPLIWPAPRTFSESGGFILTYGYEGALLVWSDVALPAELIGGELLIGADVSYLTCREECIPGEATLERPIWIGGERAPNPPEAELFKQVEAERPSRVDDQRMSAALALAAPPTPGATVTAWLTVNLCASPDADCAPLELDPLSDKAEHAFIPDRADKIVWRPQSITASADQTLTVTLTGKIAPDASAQTFDAGALVGVLRLKGADGAPRHLEITQPLKGAAIVAQTTPERAPDPGETIASNTSSQAAELGLGWALLLAFLGGILLNFMPCVFPVLSLKLAMLAKLSGQVRGEAVRHGVAYGAGIAAAMLALGLAVLALRVAGEQVGWGFQFQNPWFLVFLSVVVAAFTANLLGAFEITPPAVHTHGKLPEHGVWQSLGEGLLCVLLATPCSAPFMGTAVGFALAGDWLTILVVLQALGMGLAAPFVVLTALPGWQRFLPKPGPWFDTLRQGLAFALLATLVWLVWVFGQTQGADGMARLLGFLVAFVLSCWVWGMVQFGATRRRVVGGLMALVISAGAAWALLEVRDPASAPRAVDAAGGYGEYSDEAVEVALQAGKPVFVDFTADWCISCKVNEHGALADDAVLKAFGDHNVTLLRADWTRRDERIRAILAKHGKAGVPMYLVYSPKRPDAPEVLPELLTAGVVVEAIERAAR